jgi:hypothetical protein
MTMYFCGAESTFGYFAATRQYIARHGKPLTFYSDKASVFRVNKTEAAAGAGHTQFWSRPIRTQYRWHLR